MRETCFLVRTPAKGRRGESPESTAARESLGQVVNFWFLRFWWRESGHG